MRIFDFDPADHRADYEANGWVHIPRGVTAEFHELLLDYAREELGEHMLEGFAIKGKKEQSLFEFPEGVDYPDETFDVIAALCGLNRATMTLSERHIQAYEASAAPEPPAHKDRFPSQVSVGLSITIPEDSRLVLYPYDHRALNPYNTSAGFRRSLQPEELPEVALRDAREVEIDDHDRDVVVFPRVDHLAPAPPLGELDQPVPEAERLRLRPARRGPTHRRPARRDARRGGVRGPGRCTRVRPGARAAPRHGRAHLHARGMGAGGARGAGLR